MSEFYHNDAAQEQDLIYGTRAVIEALRAGREIERLYIQQDLHNDLIRELKKMLKEEDVIYQQVPLHRLNRLTRSNHQGVIAILSPVTYSRAEEVIPGLFETGKIPVVIILDRITDTRNLGAIARTAEGSGADAIIIPSRGSALINADAVKTSAGALFHLPVIREDNLKTTLEYLKDCGFSILACSEKGKMDVDEADFSGPVAIIMGSEENGVSQEYMKRCDQIVRLPMFGKVESYNVSVSAGMILYEMMRQRKNKS